MVPHERIQHRKFLLSKEQKDDLAKDFDNRLFGDESFDCVHEREPGAIPESSSYMVALQAANDYV